MSSRSKEPMFYKHLGQPPTKPIPPEKKLKPRSIPWPPKPGAGNEAQRVTASKVVIATLAILSAVTLAIIALIAAVAGITLYFSFRVTKKVLTVIAKPITI